MKTTFPAQCQQTGKTVTALILELARERAVDGRVNLHDLARISQVVEAMEPIYAMSWSRCRRNTVCQGVAYRRNQLLGRILAQPLESLLFACPPILTRPVLSPLFATVASLVGDSVYCGFEDKARTIYFHMLGEAEYFDWEPYYTCEQSISLFCKVTALMARRFRVYSDAKTDFIGTMKAAVPTFTHDDYYLIMAGITRPLQMEPEVSPHRAYLEASLPRSECNAVDTFLSAFHADRARWKSLAAVRRDISNL